MTKVVSSNYIASCDDELCSGCGKCWATCPDSAIGAVALSPKKLIDTGIRLASADALRQVVVRGGLVGPGRYAVRPRDALLRERKMTPGHVGEHHLRSPGQRGEADARLRRLGLWPVRDQGPIQIGADQQLFGHSCSGTWQLPKKSALNWNPR